MSLKRERIILGVLVVIIAVCLMLQYFVGTENFSDPVMAKYYIELVLYPSALASLILAWRQTLDKKIQSKKERERRFEDAKDNQ
jgi:hypothetical protein|uniref:hypothetical protein n=1 Tax=Roseivirga sp. TaxID=1964215 RepID=UPI004047FD9C